GASRLYLVPGMGHCGGGTARDQADLLTALVDWVEQGRAPDRILAEGASLEGRRPLCPYPTHAHYLGGDPASPDSYACRPTQYHASQRRLPPPLAGEGWGGGIPGRGPIWSAPLPASPR